MTLFSAWLVGLARDPSSPVFVASIHYAKIALVFVLKVSRFFISTLTLFSILTWLLLSLFVRLPLIVVVSCRDN
jgi:hypothetical protein